MFTPFALEASAAAVEHACAHIAAVRRATQTRPSRPRGTLWLHGAAIGSVCPSVWADMADVADAAAACLSLTPVTPEHARQHPQHFPIHPDADASLIGWQLQLNHVKNPLNQPPTLLRPTSPKVDLGRGHAFDTPASAALNTLAQFLHTRGACMAWRDEQIAVHGWDGQRFAPAPIATIERAAVRVLGIATQAVHLVGYVVEKTEGLSNNALQIWLQQRSPTKATHPSKWDTLMGGMCAASDAYHAQQLIENTQKIPASLQPWAASLARETWEEASLRLADLHALQAGSAIDISAAAGANEPSRATQSGQCPAAADAGWVRERIHWAAAAVPAHVQPRNQDGEVAQFALLSPTQVLTLIASGQCTPEATLVLAQFLGIE